MDKRDIAIMKDTLSLLRRKFVKSLRAIPASRLSPAEKGNVEALFQSAATSTMMAMLEKDAVQRSI